MKNLSVKTIVAIGIGAALFFVLARFVAIPSPVPNTSITTQYGLLAFMSALFGPIAGLVMSLIVCFVEMITISDSGLIGFLMNFLASGVFIGVSTAIYSRKKSLSRAIAGLIAGSFSMLAIMLLWNYIITPLYTGLPREAVLGLFLPLLIPFNLLKAALNSALILFLYKAVVTALRKSKLIPSRESNDSENRKSNTVLIVCVSALLAVTFVLVMLIFAGIISL